MASYDIDFWKAGKMSFFDSKKYVSEVHMQLSTWKKLNFQVRILLWNLVLRIY